MLNEVACILHIFLKYCFLCLLSRILQVAVYSCESQTPFQSGVQRCSFYSSGKHIVGTHSQTSALYLLLLHNRRKVQQAWKVVLSENPRYYWQLTLREILLKCMSNRPAWWMEVWMRLQSTLKLIGQATAVFVASCQRWSNNCCRDQFTTSHKKPHRLAHRSAEYQGVCPQFVTFLMTNNETTSFLIWRKARREWEELVYTLTLTANYLTCLTRCVLLSHIEQLYLERQYWCSHEQERAGWC